MVLSKSNLLIISESNTMTTSLQMILGKIFRNVYVATSEIDTESIAKEKRIDFVLCSNRVHNTSKFNDVLEVLLNEYGKEIPTIFMTDDTSSNTLLSMMKFKPEHIYLMPLDVKDLIAKITNL